ncbi:hypothetical protein D3C77_369470 [compost metagenome]
MFDLGSKEHQLGLPHRICQGQQTELIAAMYTREQALPILEVIQTCKLLLTGNMGEIGLSAIIGSNASRHYQTSPPILTNHIQHMLGKKRI